MAMEGFQPRRSIRVENTRNFSMGFGARDLAGSSRVRPSSSSRDAMAKAKMKAERPSKTRKYSSSKPNENVESKSIAVTESQLPPETTTKKKKKRKDSRTRAPSRKSSPFDCTLHGRTVRHHCALSLKKFNEICDGHKYVLVKPLCSYLNGFPLLYHCNFIARPENALDAAEDKLFFGELKYFGHVSRPVVLGCTICCILGDPSIETGIQGCTFCECEHPLDVGFLKSCREAVDLSQLTGYIRDT